MFHSCRNVSFFDDVAIEQLKSERAVAAAQRKVEFSHLHSKRPEVLAQVHADLRDAADGMADYTNPFEPVGLTGKEGSGGGKQVYFAHFEQMKSISPSLPRRR